MALLQGTVDGPRGCLLEPGGQHGEGVAGLGAGHAHARPPADQPRAERGRVALVHNLDILPATTTSVWAMGRLQRKMSC